MVKDITDPAYIGPGKWDTLHREGLDAQTPERQREAIRVIRRILETFPCKYCRTHCQQYLQNNPIEDFIGVKRNGENVGIFIWTWMFHNAVNARLHKPYTDWDTAYNMYADTDSMVCTKACEEAGQVDSAPEQGYQYQVPEIPLERNPFVRVLPPGSAKPKGGFRLIPSR